MKKPNEINIKSLKEQVYDYLKNQISQQDLKPGTAINMDATSKMLGISKTPLRDALIQLEMEEFVTILPRKGIYVNPLTRENIRNYYQIIGALERTAILAAFPKITEADINKLKKLDHEMQVNLSKDQFDKFFQKNLKFHDVFLELCGNESLIKLTRSYKKRLYDFPDKKQLLKEWEESSLAEHRELIRLVETGDAQKTADYMSDVHWSYTVQEKFIQKYYFGNRKD